MSIIGSNYYFSSVIQILLKNTRNIECFEQTWKSFMTNHFENYYFSEFLEYFTSIRRKYVPIAVAPTGILSGWIHVDIVSSKLVQVLVNANFGGLH